MSPLAREVWASRIQAVSQAFIITERLAVVNKVRRAALQTVTDAELGPLMSEMSQHGLAVLPLTRSPRASGYQSAFRSAKPGEVLDYRVVVANPEDAVVFSKAFHGSDNGAMGDLLGFPACCRAFFDQYWVRERWFDTTVPMYGGRHARSGLNLFWRWHGVRPVPHLACSGACRESHTFARELRNLMPAEQGAWMDKILSWPVLYTSFRGIAEITTPVHRTSVATDALAEKVRIEYHGTRYPAEGARGNEFPYRQDQPLTVKFGNMSNPADNGFSSLAAMVKAHDQLVVLAPQRNHTVLDLGCGDGTLARRIPAVRRIGIEQDPARAEKARKRLDRVIVGDCQDWSLLSKVLSDEQPGLIIAQRDRNPPSMFAGSGIQIISYSYEAGAEPPRIVE